MSRHLFGAGFGRVKPRQEGGVKPPHSTRVIYLGTALVLVVFGALAYSQSSWLGYARDGQHTALSPTASQPLEAIRWQTPVDLNPPYSGDDLLIHYGSPLCTTANTLILPVKIGLRGHFRVESRNGGTGVLKWKQATDYILPQHGWIPSFSPVLTLSNRLYFPGAGGTIFFRDNPDASNGATGRLAFYGLSNYLLDTNKFNSSVFINTPLTSDSSGNIYFGFAVERPNSLNLSGGIARISANGTGTWIAASAAVSDANITKPVHNCAPALNLTETVLYIAVNSGNFTAGYLAALDSKTLAPITQVRLKDPQTGNDAPLVDDGTASPTVGSDGDVFFGVLENPFSRGKGWLLHFASDLTQTPAMKPGAFGWDDTASIVPANAVPSYQGTSSYLLFTKYNNYASLGGDGVNRIAILDPRGTMVDARTGATVMKEVMTIAGVTPDQDFPSLTNAVREWCINTGVVDPQTKSVLANSEDGKLYRWDLVSNAFPQVITLTPGIGEAYTPTLIGADGTVYAINNATLFAVGTAPALSTVTIVASDSNASEPGSNRGKFTVTRTGSTNNALKVKYKIGGTASAEIDYQALSGSLNIMAGKTSASIAVKPFDDTVVEPVETVIVTLSPSNTYLIGSPGQATVRIRSND